MPLRYALTFAATAPARFLVEGQSLRLTIYLALLFSQHPDNNRPQPPILLAFDQEFGEAPAQRIAPELADPFRPLKVGEHQDVEQLGAGSGAESA